MFLDCFFIVVPFYIVFRIIFLLIKKSKPSFFKELILAIFVFYITGLLSQTVIPYGFFNSIFHNEEFQFVFTYNRPLQSINIIPFKTIYGYISSWDENAKFNIIGNVLLFIPFGFILPIVFKKFSFLKSLMIAISTSILIEFIQFFIGRSTDIDDVILNGVGFVVGYVVVKFLAFICKKITVS